MLSSDILENQFGLTQLEILSQSATERLISTFVVSTGQRLELSHVRFDTAGVQAYKSIHQLVVSGNSMGKTFRSYGIKFTRRTAVTAAINLPDKLSQWFNARGEATAISVAIYVGQQETHYADIFELYSPSVVWPTIPVAQEPVAGTDDEIEAMAAAISRLSDNSR